MSDPAYYTGVGSRQTPQPVLKTMHAIAARLRQRGYILRSGAADGADQAFESGAGDQTQIFLPWLRFNEHASALCHPHRRAYEIAAQHHPAWSSLKKSVQAIHARNVHQVLGPDLDTPSDFVLYWAPFRRLGGTGQALRVARAYDIPIMRVDDP